MGGPWWVARSISRVAQSGGDISPPVALQAYDNSTRPDLHEAGPWDAGERWRALPEVQALMEAVRRGERIEPRAHVQARPDGGLRWTHAYALHAYAKSSAAEAKAQGRTGEFTNAAVILCRAILCLSTDSVVAPRGLTEVASPAEKACAMHIERSRGPQAADFDAVRGGGGRDWRGCEGGIPHFGAGSGIHMVSGDSNGLVAPPVAGRRWVLEPLVFLAVSVFSFCDTYVQ